MTVVDPGMNLGGMPGVTSTNVPGALAFAASGSVAQSDAFATLKSLLGQYGLSSLTDWAWQQLVAGKSSTEIALALPDQQAYKDRFPAIAARAAAGLPLLTPTEYIAYEGQATQMLKAAGLPPGFYDQPSDFTSLLTKDVSLSELNDRIQQGYARVANADPLVRQAFGDLFGPSGDAALASIFLDPDRALPALEQQANAAEFGGAALAYGFRSPSIQSIEAGQLGITQSQARQGFGQLAGESALFDQTVGEANAARAGATGGQGGVNLQQGIAAQFGLNGAADAIHAVTQAEKGRVAAFSGGGGVALGKGGASGLGVSDS